MRCHPLRQRIVIGDVDHHDTAHVGTQRSLGGSERLQIGVPR
jgi:hypothetical protein